jgi:hypothetical protein
LKGQSIVTAGSVMSDQLEKCLYGQENELKRSNNQENK